MTPKPSPSSPLPRCPFCKKQEPVKACESYEVDGRGDAESGNFVVICDALHGGCGSCTGSCRTMQGAIDLWGQAARTQGADPGQPAAGLDRKTAEKMLMDFAGAMNEYNAHGGDAAIDAVEAARRPIIDRLMPAPSQGPAAVRWTRSRTDIQSYDGNGEPVVFLYPTDESRERIGIRGLDCQATADRLLAALNAVPVPAAPAAPLDLEYYAKGVASRERYLARAGREGEEEGAGGLRALREGANVCRKNGVEMDPEFVLKCLDSASSSPQRAFGQIREALRDCLRRYRCQYTKDDAGDGLQLVDVLSPGETIQEGRDEIEHLADRILALLGEAPPTSGEEHPPIQGSDIGAGSGSPHRALRAEIQGAADLAFELGADICSEHCDLDSEDHEKMDHCTWCKQAARVYQSLKHVLAQPGGTHKANPTPGQVKAIAANLYRTFCDPTKPIESEPEFLQKTMLDRSRYLIQSVYSFEGQGEFSEAKPAVAQAKAEQSHPVTSELPPGATVQPQARPMKLRVKHIKSTHTPLDHVVVDSHPIGGGAWEGPREIAEEITIRLMSFEPPHKGGQA